MPPLPPSRGLLRRGPRPGVPTSSRQRSVSTHFPAPLPPASHVTKQPPATRSPMCVQPLSQISWEFRELTSLSHAGPLNCNPGPAVASALGGRSLPRRGPPLPPRRQQAQGDTRFSPRGLRPSASLWNEAVVCSASMTPRTGCPSSVGSGWQLSHCGRADGCVLQGPDHPFFPASHRHLAPFCHVTGSVFSLVRFFFNLEEN